MILLFKIEFDADADYVVAGHYCGDGWIECARWMIPGSEVDA